MKPSLLLSPSVHRRALEQKLAGIQDKLAVVEREIAEIQAHMRKRLATNA